LLLRINLSKEFLKKYAHLVVGVGLATFWLIWGVFDFGKLGLNIPLVNRVPGFRVTGAIGTAFILLLIFFIKTGFELGRDARIIIAGGTLFTSILSGLAIRSSIIHLSNFEIYFNSLMMCLLVYFFLQKKFRLKAFYGLSSLTLATTFLVNPINFGIGEMNGESVKVVQRISEVNYGYWASDSIYTDALLMASGTASLSNQQMTGPNRRAWEILDPSRQFLMNWNRGASYITFTWSDNVQGQISNRTCAKFTRHFGLDNTNDCFDVVARS
jgi:hypothetical protein